MSRGISSIDAILVNIYSTFPDTVLPINLNSHTIRGPYLYSYYSPSIMRPSLNVLAFAVASFATCARATPVPGSTPQQVPWFDITFYPEDDCNGYTGEVDVITGQDYGCFVPQGSTRSIQVDGEGCRTTVWSGRDCHGESFVIPNSTCITTLYGSVSVNGCHVDF
ncbi:hypothetical protein F4779DRAFT_605750 [Xylariaceae sp. FL0662B]|nr:hypothetical protein F4779DRAFT_605750 [Xylariaceae sp. FL0662B]